METKAITYHFHFGRNRQTHARANLAFSIFVTKNFVCIYRKQTMRIYLSTKRRPQKKPKRLTPHFSPKTTNFIYEKGKDRPKEAHESRQKPHKILFILKHNLYFSKQKPDTVEDLYQTHRDKAF